MASPFQVEQLNPTVPQLTNRFGIYVHVPFCVHKCSYCDFYSFTKYSASDFRPYVQALTEEARKAARWLKVNRPSLNPVTSIFFGGGTPSLLPTSDLQDIFSVLRNEFEWDLQIEITLEANPETIDRKKVEEWKQLTPLNRISMGAQSFQPKYLEALERLGSPQKIQEAANTLKEVGFTNFNLDLIIGIPQQTTEEIQEDILWATRLGPKHLSNYNLTLKPGHPLFKKLPQDDHSAELYETARLSLDKQGYKQYEISNYSVPGFECSHNLLYWSGGDYLGLGPSAASRFFWEGVFHHRKQVSDHQLYLKQKSFEEVSFDASTQKQTQLEALFLELRQNRGIHLTEFFKRYGLDLRKSPKLELFQKEGFLKIEEPTLRLTDKGRLLTDSIVCEL
jgi:oxygen-independent coproporphyrinogen-3 oxidase